MMRRLSVVCLLTALAAVLAASSSPATARAAGGSQRVRREVKKAAAARDSDRNIKIDRQATPTSVRTQGPQARGGARTRGAWGQVHVESHSGYFLDIYVDGDYAGTVGPYADLTAWATAGGHTLYGRAFGADWSWGPWQFTVPAGATYTWRLY
jgi:hypothetical protein